MPHRLPTTTKHKTIQRHDPLVLTLTRVARTCGVFAQVEPRIDEKDKSRVVMDIILSLSSGVFDVMVVHPTCPLGSSLLNPNLVRRRMEAEKSVARIL